MLQRRLDLRAVEPNGAVHATVADEDDVVVVGEPTRVGELHVREAGAALEAEDGSPGCADLARMRVTGSAIRRERGSVRFSGTTSVPQSAG